MIVAALGRAVARAAGSRTLRFDLEGHGRDDETFEAVDLSRTVGWFTALYPVAFELDPQGDPGSDIRRVKEALRSVSSARFEHGMLCAAGRIERGSPAEIVVNYLGRLDLALEEGSRFAAAEEAVGPSRAASQRRPYPIEINAGIYDGRLRAEWVYDVAWGEGVANAAAHFHAELKTLIAHCLSPSGGDATPSDFRSVALSPAELDDIASELGLDDLEDA